MRKLGEHNSLDLQRNYKTYETDKEFVSDLIANDEDAWKYFIDFSSRILALHKKHLTDYNVSIDELVSETYLYLNENDYNRLRKFQKDGKSFIGFVYYAVRASKSRLLYRLKKKRMFEVSEMGLDFHLTENRGDEFAEKIRQRQYREFLMHAFSLLWQSNSSRAYVYMLRRKIELSSKEVANLLGLKVNNVDVTLRRAEREMKNILEEMGASNDILFD